MILCPNLAQHYKKVKYFMEDLFATYRVMEVV
jgi:hypothetical protein